MFHGCYKQRWGNTQRIFPKYCVPAGNECRCCIARSRYNFPALILTALTFPSLLRYTSVMIPSIHCALFRSSWFMRTTSPTLTSGSLLLCFKLCLSRNDVRYSFLHFFHAASLHLYFCLLLSISVGSSLGITGFWPNSVLVFLRKL